MASIHPIPLPNSLPVPLPSPTRSSIQMSPTLAPADPLSTLRALLPRRRPLPPRLFAQLHALLLTSGLARHSPNFSLLLRLSSSLRVSHRLRLLLCSPLRPTAFLANSLLLQPSLHLPSALSLFSLLFLFSFSPLRPNAFTYPPLLRASPPSTAVALATHSLKFLGAGAASQDRVLGAALLDVFARCGRIASCRRVFDRIVDPDLPAWNALLSAYARRARDAACAGSAAEVLDLFRRMISTKVRPNEITLVSVIGACGELGALGHGVWAHAYALKRRLAVNCFVATALVETYARCGRLDLAEQVFAAVADVDTRCYNAILHGLAVHGHGRAALALFGRMRGEGVPVDGVTVLAVMCACAHAGLVDQGQQCFDRMEVEFGVAPRIEHYGCMVDMLGRAGQLDDADKLIRGMDIPLNAAICRSLIRACGIHGKLELGERMVGELMRLEPEHGGNYVLQSSLYARMSRWEDAKKARKEMKTMGIDKSPGSSLLDIDGVLHEFLMGDKTHPASKEIYAMVGEIEARLSECGHRLSTTAVLFDVEEEDKADALSYHSERLAVAFALIASAPGTPIRIIKNLRVCIDCHESTKIVSRVYCREIVMRDRTRFHHFRDGQCSCADFCAAPIVGMNVSLMWNSAEFYQISKLCMTPASCVLEVVFDHVHYSWDTKLSIMVVLIGVAVCTITDVSVNAKGLIAAVIAVWSTALQQYYSLNSFNLLGHTAPTQAGSLPLVGPFVDFLFTGKRVDHFNFTSLALTVVVLFIGFLFFGKEDQNFQVALGMVLAVLGMIWYGNASAKPGGKERRSILPVRSDRPNGASEEKDGGEK